MKYYFTATIYTFQSQNQPLSMYTYTIQDLCNRQDFTSLNSFPSTCAGIKMNELLQYIKAPPKPF